MTRLHEEGLFNSNNQRFSLPVLQLMALSFEPSMFFLEGKMDDTEKHN